MEFKSQSQKVKKKLCWTRHLIPYNPGLRIFSENHLAKTIDPIVVYTNAKKLGKSLESLLRKGQKSQRKFFWTQHLIPYNPGLRIFQKKTSGSNDGPYHPLHSRTKFGKSLEPF